MKTPPPINPPQPLVQSSSGADFGTRLLLPVGRSGWAIAAGYLGLFSLILLPAPLAVLVSIMAIVDIRKSRTSPKPKHGMGRAIFGLVLGILGSIVLVLVLLNSIFEP